MGDLPLTRQSLLLRLKARSEDAWQEFLSIYERALLEYAMRKGLQEADARDLIQELLAALEKKVVEWEPDPKQGKLRGWIMRVARNMAVDKIAERARTPLALGGLNSGAMENIATCREQETQEFSMEYRRRLLHWAAERVRQGVSETTWQAFWLTAMKGRSVDEVKDQLDLTRGNIYAAKFRVTAKIQQLVDSIGDLDDAPTTQQSEDPQ